MTPRFSGIGSRSPATAVKKVPVKQKLASIYRNDVKRQLVDRGWQVNYSSELMFHYMFRG